ncbi:MAG: ornithine carbamoyltransferase [Candidatus Aenigmarchaeota archaeon]|nr:ornithine carbamoyltransferase [Candidatus Aenigmarchaeota archaeon]
MKHFLTMLELSKQEFEEILNTAKSLKRAQQQPLKGKVLGMIFEKPSTRTRVSFEVGMQQLGGHAVYLNKNDIQIGRGETVADTSRVLSRYCDFLMARVFSHSTLEEMAKYSSVPVINGLSDIHHPCQIMGDLLTLQEKFGKLMGLKLAYVGDGNNVCNSLLIGCAMAGVHISVGCPNSHAPNKDVIREANNIAKSTGSKIEIVDDPVDAVRNAHAIYTDTWVSMGDEAQKEEREKIFKNYQVNSVLGHYATPNWVFMHCLPAHRGQEVTNDVIDGKHSVVWDEAENRLHIQKAILAFLDKRRSI